MMLAAVGVTMVVGRGVVVEVTTPCPTVSMLSMLPPPTPPMLPPPPLLLPLLVVQLIPHRTLLLQVPRVGQRDGLGTPRRRLGAPRRRLGGWVLLVPRVGQRDAAAT